MKQTTLYRVTIRFTDGFFQVSARADDAESAYRLALQDARMGHPCGNCYGQVLGWEAVPCADDEQIPRRIWSGSKQDEARIARAVVDRAG